MNSSVSPGRVAAHFRPGVFIASNGEQEVPVCSMRAGATGLLWCRTAAQYAGDLALCAASAALPQSVSSWQRKARNGYEGLLRQGHGYVKVPAPPDEFKAWCAA